MAAKKKTTPRPVRNVSVKLTEEQYWGLVIRATENKASVSDMIREHLAASLDKWAEATRRNPKKVLAAQAAEQERALERQRRRDAELTARIKEFIADAEVTK